MFRVEELLEICQVQYIYRTHCHTGTPIESPLHVVDPTQSGSPRSCYHDHPRSLAAEKIAHVTQMCHKCDPPTRWPSYITSPVQQSVPPILASASMATDSSFGQASSGTNTSRAMPSTVQEELRLPPAKRTKRASRTCNTPGCDGSGVRNKKRWNEGHATKAGCPRDRR